MGSRGRDNVAILGGGMAALTAALHLSEPSRRDRFDRITVYQRGWRLGGKGASSRGRNGRIEEHGLHVLLGYYHDTFDLLRRCYDELDRPRTDPGCPILRFDDAVAPSNLVGVTERGDDGWAAWVASFGTTPDRPGGAATATSAAFPMSVPDVAARSIKLLADFFASLGSTEGGAGGSAYLSASQFPHTRTGSLGRLRLEDVMRGAGLLGLALQLSCARRLAAFAAPAPAAPGIEEAVSEVVGPLRAALASSVASDRAARRTFHLIELVIANLVGIAGDRLLGRPEGFDAIDHMDYRDWLSGHGIDPTALDSPLLRGMYDLVFAYEGADAARPRFSAGLGVQLATRMLLGYSGALFWKMQAGMGEVVFAPMYQVLRDRGVDFRFFHRVDALHLTPDGRRVQSVDIGVQADVVGGAAAYDPLIRVKGLPCWPDRPLAWQLRNPGQTEGLDLESFWSPRRDSGVCTLVGGEDFDAVVFGISLGMVPYVCADVLEHHPAWRAMVDNIGTVATQSLQLWLRADERALGWPAPEGVTLSGFAKPFDTWASMSHLLPREDWPEASRPRSIAYFCGAMPPPRPPGGVDTAAEHRAVMERACDFLDGEVSALWPAAVGPHGFRWELLCDGGSTAPASRAHAIEGQFWRANVDPSDLYVQSLPGSGRFRLAPGSTGVDNLVVAGDWTDCGLNAGCVEAATLSGRLAADAVLEGPSDAAGGVER